VPVWCETFLQQIVKQRVIEFAGAGDGGAGALQRGVHGIEHVRDGGLFGRIWKSTTKRVSVAARKARHASCRIEKIQAEVCQQVIKIAKIVSGLGFDVVGCVNRSEIPRRIMHSPNPTLSSNPDTGRVEPSDVVRSHSTV